MMKHVKLLEDYFYANEGNNLNSWQERGFKGFSFPHTVPLDSEASVVFLNALPKGLKNELTRPVKDMLTNSNAYAWADLDYIIPKIEKLMAKSGLQWNRFPEIKSISGIKSIDKFVKWLERGYYQALEDAYFS